MQNVPEMMSVSLMEVERFNLGAIVQASLGISHLHEWISFRSASILSASEQFAVQIQS